MGRGYPEPVRLGRIQPEVPAVVVVARKGDGGEIDEECEDLKVWDERKRDERMERKERRG